jgi:hypothetical protein
MDTAASPFIGVAPTTDFEVALVMADLLAVMGKDDAAKTAFDSLNRQFTALQLIQNAPEERAAPLAGMYFHLARIGWDPKQPGDALLDTLQHILDLPQVQRAGVGQASSMAEVYYQFALVANRAKAPLERVANALLLALKLEPDHLDARVKLGEFYWTPTSSRTPLLPSRRSRRHRMRPAMLSTGSTASLPSISRPPISLRPVR